VKAIICGEMHFPGFYFPQLVVLFIHISFELVCFLCFCFSLSAFHQ